MSIKHFVDKIELNELKKDYYKTFDIMNIISNYVKKHNLILYGGYAINLILPENKKIYKKHTQADFDCYSYNAKENALNLARFFKKKKYKYIKVKIAKHEDTYKVFIGKINIIDITLIDKKIYKILLEIHNDELNKDNLKYYKETFKLVPYFLLKRNLYYELAKPLGSYYRWEKVDKRLKLLNTLNKTNKYKNLSFIKIPNNLIKCKEKLLNYMKNYKTPIIGTYALKLIKNIKDNNCCRLNNYDYLFQILSKKYNKTCREIVNIIKNNIDLKYYKLLIIAKTNTSSSIDILKFRYRIQLLDPDNNLINLIEIIKVKDNCYSIQKIKGYNVGSYDTILCFLYSHYITMLIGKYINPSRKNNALENIQKNINYYENILKNVKTSKRYKIKCYGAELTKSDIYEKNWYKKLSLLKYK